MELENIEDGSIDAGLLMLGMVTKEGQKRTAQEIADVCGVSDQTILNIQHKALAKMRRKMEKIMATKVQMDLA